MKGILALDLQAGDTLFIASASGAISTLEIQLAKAKGYRIAGSSSSKNHALMLSLAVDKAVDYKNPNRIAQVKDWNSEGVDAVLQPSLRLE